MRSRSRWWQIWTMRRVGVVTVEARAQAVAQHGLSSSTPVGLDAFLALSTDQVLLGLNFIPRAHPADAKIGSRRPPIGHGECTPPTRHQTRFLASDCPRTWGTTSTRSMPTNRSFYALFWLTPVGPTPVIDGDLISPGGFQLPLQTSDLRAEVDPSRHEALALRRTIAHHCLAVVMHAAM